MFLFRVVKPTTKAISVRLTIAVSKILLLFISTIAIAQSSNDSFVIGDVELEAGESYRGFLQVPEGSDGVSTVIPITVHNGSEAGPTVSLIAGIHGSEYSPILSMQEVAGLINPIELKGTLVIVHIANLPAFTGRTIYFGPNDLKNLNRSFPGDPQGTITERIAHALTTEVIDRSDYLLDIHSGDANESL